MRAQYLNHCDVGGSPRTFVSDSDCKNDFISHVDDCSIGVDLFCYLQIDNRQCGDVVDACIVVAQVSVVVACKYANNVCEFADVYHLGDYGQVKDLSHIQGVDDP